MTTEGFEDADQQAYQVKSNIDPFHSYRDRFLRSVQEYQSNYEDLSIEMEQHFYNRKQPKEEFDRKMEFCVQLKSVILKYCPDWTFNVVPTGSSVSGLATADSDLDVAIHMPIWEKNAANSAEVLRGVQLNILQIIRRIITNDEEFKQRINFEKGVQLVQAQIQILKIETTDGIEGDICVILDPFLSSMHNSHLIRHYYHLDSRFGPLCAIVKEWAASTKVKDPKDGGFNSYAMVLLVIHFLQCGTHPPILPNLQKVFEGENFVAENQHNFPRRLDFGAPLPRQLPEISKNNANVAELFFQFVHYYANFNFQILYISIPSSRVMKRSESHHEVQLQRQKEVYIKDPFDDHNPGRTCRNLKFIRYAFRETVRKFDPSSSSNFKFPTLNDILQMKMNQDKGDNDSDQEDVE